MKCHADGGRTIDDIKRDSRHLFGGRAVSGELSAGGTDEALWLVNPNGPLKIGPSPCATPRPGEVVIRVAAVPVNPVDAITGPFRRIVTPWVRYPTVLGSDVAGEMVEVGAGVARLRAGDRVLGFAAGQEKPRNSTTHPTPVTLIRAVMARARGIQVTSIWGGTPVQSPVGPAIFSDLLPAALTDGRFRPAPDPSVFGVGLQQVPGALAALRRSISAKKIVVTVQSTLQASPPLTTQTEEQTR